MDTKRIEAAIEEILWAIGENPNREGLKETPKRVAKMYEEIFKGINYTNDEIANMFNKTFNMDKNNVYNKSMVVVKDINCFSTCEHHLALIYNMKIHVAYIPTTKIIGLSKIARIADLVCRRPQIQERIGQDIADIIKNITESQNVAVIIEAEHGCMTARGIEKSGTKTITSTVEGLFYTDTTVRSELFQILKGVQ